jgi:hypothetical protein
MFNYEGKAKREHKVDNSDLQRLVQQHLGQEVVPNP